ncbi:MAG: hypothetical protein IPM08_15740 [Actinomycetales bacterium]|nr:hypothetical protein [Actinomycetales bacterium]
MVLAPPVSAGFVAEVVSAASRHRDRQVAEPIYGTDCALRLVDEVVARSQVPGGLFRSEEEVLQLPGSDSRLAVRAGDPSDH